MANAFLITPNDISNFREMPFDFLSNMYSSPLTMLGHTFECAEAAFHAHKALGNDEAVARFAQMNGFEAKRYGRAVALRFDWNTAKLVVMRDVIRAKFAPGSQLATKLLNTGTKRLVESNTWHDVYWGVCNGKGQNMLGTILMERRAALRGISASPNERSRLVQ